jgi:taurine--2-oxoglutarate transaminase
MSDIKEIIRDFTDHSYGPWKRQKDWKKPLFVERAEGVYLYDEDNKPYIDFSSQFMCSNLGHGNKAIIEAIHKQADELVYVAPVFAHRSGERATAALMSIMPKGLDRFFFSTSGSLANESAVQIIRQCMAPRFKIIARYHSYHGGTASGMTLTGGPRHKFAERDHYGIQGVIFAPDAYCYRCPFGQKYPDCNVCCAEYVGHMIKEEGNIAAVFVEPVVGTNGKQVPPPEYFPRLRQICDENDVLLVVDEVMSGWFRTGKPFAIDNWGVKPDILSTAKGCTSSYTPIGITATGGKVTEYYEDNIIYFGFTYTMHPLMMAAIPAAISEYRRLEATGIFKRVSAYLQEKLYELQDRHECIGDVRGIGHFWAIELVKNRKTKEPFNVKADKFYKQLMTDRIAAEALKKGMFIMSWYDHLTIAPPLIISEDEVDDGIRILDDVLKIADKEVEHTGVAGSHSCESFIKNLS